MRAPTRFRSHSPMSRLPAAWLLACVIVVADCGGENRDVNVASSAAPLAAAAASATFTNPIVPALGTGGSADPSVVYRDGWYHYCRTLNDGAVGIARARRLQDIGSAPMVTVWTPPPGLYSRQLWAPELE